MKNNYFALILILTICNACSSSSDSNSNSTENQIKKFKRIAKTHFLGQPIKKGVLADDNSKNAYSFRIPGVITLKNGTVMIASDIRYGSTADSPHNIDTVARFSDDNGTNWKPMKYIQKFDDFSDTNIPGKGNASPVKYSASYIDPGIVQAPNGDILVITTVFPKGGGNIGGSEPNVALKQNSLNPFTNVNGKLYIKLMPKKANKARNNDLKTEATYTHMAPIDGGKIIARATKSETEYSIDKDWFVYTNDIPLSNKQYAEGSKTSELKFTTPEKKVKTHLFYYESPYWPVAKSYVFLSRSTDNGKTFSQPKDISHMIVDPSKSTGVLDNKAWFYGVSPGVGYTIQEGKYKGRILVALQPAGIYQGLGCAATTIYSDDNGTTWKAGVAVKPTTKQQRLSETQFVEGPENQLFAFHRSGEKTIAYSISIDGGIHWEPFQSTLTNIGTGGVMIGATAMRMSTLYGQKMLAISHVNKTGLKSPDNRSHGAVSIGYFKKSHDMYPGTTTKMYVPTFPSVEDNNPDFWTWIRPEDNPTHHFAYSAITELSNGNLAVFYEYHNSPSPGGTLETRSIDYSIIQLDRE